MPSPILLNCEVQRKTFVKTEIFTRLKSARTLWISDTFERRKKINPWQIGCSVSGFYSHIMFQIIAACDTDFFPGVLMCGITWVCSPHQEAIIHSSLQHSGVKRKVLLSFPLKFSWQYFSARSASWTLGSIQRSIHPESKPSYFHSIFFPTFFHHLFLSLHR